ncbi:MAG: MBL fold metallo-hydrolase [Gemmatimonadota bacterium]
MIVTLWGTRGTFPVPGAETLRHGGDTSCLSVEWGRNVLVVDVGTGARRLGAELKGRDVDLSILLTHIHGDHVLGLPFFAPLWERDRTIVIFDADTEEGPWSPLALLDGRHFPVRAAALPAYARRIAGDPMPHLNGLGLPIRRQRCNHPGRTYGYRIGVPGRDVVFMPDNELGSSAEGHIPFEAFVRFANGAAVLAHDAQFTADEIHRRGGWGHSSIEQAVALAEAAGVGKLVLVHHDPWRTDDQLDALTAAAAQRTRIPVEAGRDGMRLELGED